MIKKIKTMLGNIIAATISILILCSWFIIPFDAEASVPTAPRYTVPSAGAGRITCVVAEEMHDDEQVAGTLESSTETLVLQEETKTEDVFDAVPANYEQVTVNQTEEWVECVPDPDPIIETDIDALIVQIAGEYGLPWELVRAVCFVESNFNPRAVSPTGDYGLMQVYYGVWNSLGVDLEHDTIQFDPEYNLRVGCGILKEKIDSSGGDLTTALIKYNIGDGDARQLFKRGIFSTDYTDKVLERYYAYLRGEY